jgi:probable rRNA maturation factor
MTKIMTITILKQHKTWPALTTDIRTAVKATLAAENCKGDVAVVLSDDASVQILNRDYRGKDKPTNVLSFEAGEEGMLGDVILAYETVAREAAEQGKTLRNHTLHLVVHGVLHLSGHDHEQNDEAKVMEKQEIAILATLGIANPYRLS